MLFFEYIFSSGMGVRGFIRSFGLSEDFGGSESVRDSGSEVRELLWFL